MQQPQPRTVIPTSHKPISPWGYIGYSFLYAIPVIGFIVWLCNALGAKNKNVKNFARAYFCAFVLAIILALVVAAVLAVVYFAFPEVFANITEYLDQFTGNFNAQ